MQRPALEELFKTLAPSERGLASQEASRRLATVAPNEPVKTVRTGGLHQILRSFANPLVAILLLAAIVSAFLGEIVNASIIVVIVALSVALDSAQTYRSQRAADRLREGVAPTATVLGAPFAAGLASP